MDAVKEIFPPWYRESLGFDRPKFVVRDVVVPGAWVGQIVGVSSGIMVLSGMTA